MRSFSEIYYSVKSKIVGIVRAMRSTKAVVICGSRYVDDIIPVKIPIDVLERVIQRIWMADKLARDTPVYQIL